MVEVFRRGVLPSSVLKDDGFENPDFIRDSRPGKSIPVLRPVIRFHLRICDVCFQGTLSGIPIRRPRPRAMKDSAMIRTCVGIAVLAAVTANVSADKPNPEPKGAQRVSALIAKLKSAKIDEQLEAAGEVREMGPYAKRAIPHLIALFDSKDLAVRCEVVSALGTMGDSAAIAIPKLIGLLDDDSATLRYSTIKTLREIGEHAKPAADKLKALMAHRDTLTSMGAAWALVRIVPDDRKTIRATIPLLVRGLENKAEHIRSGATLALAEIGEPAVSALIVAAAKPDIATTTHACDALGLIGPDAESAVPTLLKLLSATDATVCWHAARALGTIGRQPKTVVPALTELLKHKSKTVRLAALTVIGQYGVESAAAVSAVMPLAQDSDVRIRLAAIDALGEIGPGAHAAVKLLDKALEDPVGSVTVNAAESLGKIGKPAVGVLTARLGDPKLRLLALSVLASIGRDAKSAVPEIVKLTSVEDRTVRIEAFLAIAAMGADAEAAVPALMKIAETPGHTSRNGAIYALTRIGSRKILPMLKKIVNDPNETAVKLVSSWALVRFEPTNAEYVKLAIPQLIGALDHELPIARIEAVSALGLIGAKASPAVPALIKVLSSDDPAMLSEALHALGQIGPASKPAVAKAVGLLNHPESDVRTAATFALGKIGRGAKSAVPALRNALKSRVTMERTIAAWALIKIDPQPEYSRIAIPLLTNALNHPNPDARAEAARTLGSIAKGNKTVAKSLQERAVIEQEQDVRETILKALKQVRGK